MGDPEKNGAWENLRRNVSLSLPPIHGISKDFFIDLEKRILYPPKTSKEHETSDLVVQPPRSCAFCPCAKRKIGHVLALSATLISK